MAPVVWALATLVPLFMKWMPSGSMNEALIEASVDSVDMTPYPGAMTSGRWTPSRRGPRDVKSESLYSGGENGYFDVDPLLVNQETFVVYEPVEMIESPLAGLVTVQAVSMAAPVKVGRVVVPKSDCEIHQCDRPVVVPVRRLMLIFHAPLLGRAVPGVP